MQKLFLLRSNRQGSSVAEQVTCQATNSNGPCRRRGKVTTLENFMESLCICFPRNPWEPSESRRNIHATLENFIASTLSNQSINLQWSAQSSSMILAVTTNYQVYKKAHSEPLTEYAFQFVNRRCHHWEHWSTLSKQRNNDCNHIQTFLWDEVPADLGLGVIKCAWQWCDLEHSNRALQAHAAF